MIWTASGCVLYSRCCRFLPLPSRRASVSVSVLLLVFIVSEELIQAYVLDDNVVLSSWNEKDWNDSSTGSVILSLSGKYTAEIGASVRSDCVDILRQGT